MKGRRVNPSNGFRDHMGTVSKSILSILGMDQLLLSVHQGQWNDHTFFVPFGCITSIKNGKMAKLEPEKLDNQNRSRKIEKRNVRIRVLRKKKSLENIIFFPIIEKFL